jgi:uncharacterized membrane protein YfcA
LSAFILVASAFLIAFIYSSVGHGGASGYLALLSFFAFPHREIASSALCLNVLVAGIAFYIFARNGHFSWALTWPFAVASVPAAFLGGLIRVGRGTYSILLGAVLIYAALRLFFSFEKTGGGPVLPPPPVPAGIIGFAIGFLSGIVGVGGGIFLSPLLLLLGWCGAKQAAAASAFFILVNSAAGIAGRISSGNFEMSPFLAGLLIAAAAGGLAGARLGAQHLPPLWLRRVLAGVLILACVKLLVGAV